MTNSFTIHDLNAIIAEWRARTARGENTWTVTVHGSDVDFRHAPDGSTFALLYPAGGSVNYAGIRDQDLIKYMNEDDDLDATFAFNIEVWLTSPSARGEAIPTT